MKYKVFTENMQMGQVFSFIKPAIVELDNGLDEQGAAQIAQMYGAPLKRAFQSALAEDGSMVIGLRFKPVAIIVPETSPRFASNLQMSRKLAK